MAILYKWFKAKLDIHHQLNSIDKRTDKYHYERYPNVDVNTKSDFYEAKNYPTFFESNHRTDTQGILPPKDKYYNNKIG